MMDAGARAAQVTKAYRGHDGSMTLTFNEGAFPFNFTIRLSRNFAPRFFYVCVAVFGRAFRWHWKAA